MGARILFSSDPAQHEVWLPALRSAFEEKGISGELSTVAEDPASVRYIVYSPDSELNDFSQFSGLRVVQSLWAGVEEIIGNETVTVPLARMVDPGMIYGMREWVVAQVLRHHLGLDQHILNKSGEWLHHLVPPLARSRTVLILGLGELGRVCAIALSGLGFHVLGWSRTPKKIQGIDCRFSMSALTNMLAVADILVLLLPRTAETENILNKDRMFQLRKGAVIINPGRGQLIDDEALLEALDMGHIAHATLDVFRVEPLPPNHLFWSHPGITVSPHVASETQPETASHVVAENIRRDQSGQPLLHLVDRKRGY